VHHSIRLVAKSPDRLLQEQREFQAYWMLSWSARCKLCVGFFCLGSDWSSLAEFEVESYHLPLIALLFASVAVGCKLARALPQL
jgi:hypothetical protein